MLNKRDLNRGNKKTLYKVESSSSEERTFPYKEKFVSAEVFSMFRSLCLTSTAIPYTLMSKFLFWFFNLILHLITMHYVVYLSHHKKMFLSIHSVFMFLRKGKRVVGQHYWTQLKNPRYLDGVETRLGHVLCFLWKQERNRLFRLWLAETN